MPHRRRDETGTTKRPALLGLLALAAAASSCSHIEGTSGAPDGGNTLGSSEGEAANTVPFALERSEWRHRVLADETGFQLAGDATGTQEEPSPARLGWGRELGSRSVHRRLRSESEQRIEVDLGWSVGVVANHSEGVEQSWEIAARPATPTLEVRVPIEGALHLGSGEDGLVFRTADREYLVYGHAVWIDADGRRTPVLARFDGEEIALSVGQEVLDRSTYPAVLDPIIGTARSLTPTQLTNANADQENPDIAIGATSRLVVWSDDRAGAAPGVFGTFRDQTGTLEERYAFRIGSARLTGTAVAPSVAYAGGIYLVAWATYDTVYAARVAEGGGVLDTTPLAVFVGGDPKGATVTTDGVEFVVAWIDEGAPAGVRARRVTVDGGFLGAPIWIRQDAAFHTSVRAAHDPAGGYWVVFDEDSSGNRDLALVRLAADASVRDPVPLALAAGFADQARPDIAFAGGGNAMVVYMDSSTNAVHGVTVTEGGGGSLSFGTPTRISGGSGEQSPRVVNAGSNYHVGWISSAPGTASPQVATISGPLRADGVTLGAGISTRIALAVDAASTVHAVWQATNAETDAIDIYRRTRGVSSSMWALDTSLVSQAPHGQASPKIANNSSRSLAAWVQRTAGGKRVYAARINALGEFEDVVAFPVGRESLDALMVGVYSDGDDFLVVWQARELRSFTTGSAVVWVATVAHVTTAGVASAPIDCGAFSTYVSPADVWLDRSVFPTRYVATFIDGDVIYNGDVRAASCGSRFLYEDPTVIDATSLVSTANAVYFVSRTGDLHRVNQTTAPGGGSGAPVAVGASDLATLDVLPGSSDTIAYSNSPPRFPPDQRVGVVRLSSAGAIQWHVSDLADHVATTANPQLARFGGGTFVVWRQTDNTIVGQRLGTMGERVDPVPATIDAEPRSRYLGDVVTDFLDRSLLVYSAVLPEQGWATRIRARAIDFRFDAGSALGEACTTGFDCASGICADGVCCNAACGYSRPDDCQACSVAAGAAEDGTCSTLVTGTECRASAGECDVAEVCDGTGTACPANALAPAGSACGTGAEGPCDLADRCNGASATCESRGFAPAGTSCRASRGGCDAEDVCDGVQGACADTFLAAGVVCRGSDGGCDVAETCDGETDVCPIDVVETAGVECRAAAGGCDVPETCDGSAAACPIDVVLDATQVCRVAAGACDRQESCDGITGACPPDSFFGSSTQCRPAASECDAPESCDGASAACRADAAAANGTTCGADLACENASCVDGACVSTPVVCEAGAVCSEAMGGCPASPVEPEPTPGMGGGCQAAGPGASGLPAAMVVLLGLVLSLLRRRSETAARRAS